MTGMRAAGPVAAAAIIASALGLGCNAGPIDIATLSTTSLAAGLVGHWTFDEGAGTQVRDSSGNSRHGAIFGTNWTWTAGRFPGGALSLGGTDQVTVGGGFGFPQATRSYSVSAWVRVTETDLQAPVAAILSTEIPWGVGPPGGWSLNLDLEPPVSGSPPSGNYHFTYWIGAANDPLSMEMTRVECPCFVPDVWTHLAAVVDAAEETLTFYVNGIPRQQVDVPRSIGPGEQTLYMGRWPSSPPHPLTGTLDDVAIYARALVPEEIVQLSRAPAPDPF
jgi:hypothetical protein